jgi:uncharacterized membrane protein YccC
VDEERQRRLDEHMNRGNAIMERSNAIMERSNAIMRRSNEVMLRNEIAFRDLRDFLAEQTLALRGLTREIAQRGDQFVAEMEAQRQALFRIFDRLDGEAS